MSSPRQRRRPRHRRVHRIPTDGRGVTLYAGIDPGLTGAVAILDQSKLLVDVFDMPVVDKQVNAVELAYVIAGYGDPFVTAIERVASMPGQGVASTFKFGMSYGIALGV